MGQVIACDLDGTLLTPDVKIDPYTASTLRELSALGHTFVLATARHWRDAAHFRAALGIRAYLISINGARVHAPDGAQLFGQDLDPEIARALVRPEIAGDRRILAYCEEGWLVNRPWPHLDAYCQGAGFTSRVLDLESHDGRGLANLMFWGEPDDLARAEAAIHARFPGRLYITFTTERCFDIMDQTVSKGRALAEVLRRLDVPASACIAFGDGDNDADMLLAAGRPFVMSGGSPKLRAALPGAPSGGDHADSGVARTLRGLFGLPA